LGVSSGLKLARLREIFSWLKNDFDVLGLDECTRRLAPGAGALAAS
jgi:hypothetical protein